MKYNPILKIFSGFVGQWKIKRSYGYRGHANGFVSFIIKEENKLEYQEISNVKLGNTISFEGHKTYIYEYKDGQILKKFDENPSRLFYQLNFLQNYNYATGNHLCKDDQYNADYHFKDKNNFILFYKVTGPKKEYTITTKFKRMIHETRTVEELFNEHNLVKP